MAETVEIRKCRAEEVARTGRFYDNVVRWLNEHVNHPRWIYGVYPSEGSVRTMAEAGAQYLCIRGGSIVGAFALNTEPQGSYQKADWSRALADGSYMILHALAVDPRLQRQGLGAEVIRFCADKAKADGYQAIRIDVVPTNIPARRLFEKNGFSYVGDVDLELPIGDIPAFSMYELNI
ncbi:MAG: GNAT family N-acetyltransferase [Oscillospiraceae bacterium]|nr:GNAT family N-acetyltransferase [Oscillospiraceae bacterium]